VTHAGLDYGHQRVTTRVVQGVKELCVARMMAAARADQATMEAAVIKAVLQIVLITHVLLLMGHASVLKDIMGNVVKARARALVKTVRMAPSARCVQLVDTVHYVTLYVTVTAVHVISLLDSVMNNPHVRHSAPCVQPLEFARHV